ncbi:MAG TPA: flagellar basal body rod protein FlgC [Bryobacteraceae bacterium]|nr:flagellar basal body rod protein FlgC [Bryobacteraceae bacterium]
MSLFSAISVSASGMEAQRVRAELIAGNLANADTTRTPEGGPYRRRDAVFTTAPVEGSFAEGSVADGSFAESLAAAGVRVASISVDAGEPERRYLPGHPDADKDGYVAFPKIHPPEEMVDLMGASRGYEANVAAIATVKDMIGRSLDLFK